MQKLKHKTVKLVVDKCNIGKLFVMQKNRRMIREGIVRSLYSTLISGEHFDTGLVANKKKGKYHLIDGNHRAVALQRYIAKHPKERVEINIHYYEDLAPSREKEIYTKWNLGTKQNKNDFLQQYKEEISFLKFINESFPCKIFMYPGKDGIHFSRLLDSYFMATTKVMNFRGLRNGPEAVRFAKSLTRNDYNYLYAYFVTHRTAFGDIEKNAYTGATILPALMKLWWDNRNRCKPARFLYYFRKRLFNKARLLFWVDQHGAEAREAAYRDIKAMLNKGVKIKFL